MNIIDVFLIITSVFSFFLAFLIYYKNLKSIVNFSFFIFIVNAALWPFSIALFRMSQDVTTALFWDKLIYISGTLVPASFFNFSYVFVNKHYPKKIYQLFNLLVPSLFILVLLSSNLWVEEIIIKPGEKFVALGPIYLIWVIYFGLLMGLGTLLLFRKYKHSIGSDKAQLNYVFLSVLFPIIGAFPFNILLPLFGNYQLIFIGPFFLTMMILVISYAVIKHRLFDIKFALQQLIVYFISVFLTVTLLFLFTLFYTSLINATIRPDVIFLIIVISIVLILILEKFRLLAQIIASKYLFQSIYDYQKTLKELSLSLSSFIEMPKLTDVITDTLIKTMRLNRIAVLIRNSEDDHYKIQKTIGFNEENGIALVRDNFLTSYLERYPKIIVLDELKRLSEESKNTMEKEGLRVLLEHMEHIEATLIIPIMNSGKMISLIVLGNKISNEAYTVQDIDLLTTIASQASIAIENARLYKEIQEFNRNLEGKVKEATAEIQKRNTQLEEANIQIGLASKVKNDLLTMASHEFRTPTAIINNALWFLNKDEVRNKLTDKERENLERIVNTMGRLNYVVNNINQMLLTTSGELELEVTPVQLEIIIKEVIEDKQMEASDKQIKIDYEENTQLLPEIVGDKVKLKYVIWELVTNALKYTEKEGKITVSSVVKDSAIDIKIADTGRGIPKELLPTLFEGFKKIDIMHTTQSGMGLGLYIVKKIIELHEGSINVESKEGEGTTFTLTLPMKDISDIKPTKHMVHDDALPYFSHISAPANYQQVKGENLPHPLQVIKCIVGFQMVMYAILASRV